MKWNQKEIADVYRAVKKAAADIDTNNKSRGEVVAEIRQKLKYQFGYRPYVRGSVLFNNYSRTYSRADKKFKRFIKPKYNRIGLPSKEISMLDKMIDNVVDGLQCNETSLSDLDSTVSKMNTITHRAKNINSDCEDILHELDKISDYLDEKCQNI
jgi:hypothetical protein